MTKSDQTALVKAAYSLYRDTRKVALAMDSTDSRNEQTIKSVNAAWAVYRWAQKATRAN